MTMDRLRSKVASPEVEAASKHEILRLSPFAELTGPSRDALLELGRLERLPRRTRIAEQGEPARCVFLIGAGRVKLERLTRLSEPRVEGAEGAPLLEGEGTRVFPLGYRGPGQLVGEAALAGVVASPESASVVDDVEAVTLPLAGLRKLIGADAAVRAATAGALLSQNRATEERLASLLLYGVEARLVGLLLDAVRRWGKPSEAGQLISAPFTHAEMALLIGSTRETVTLLLGKLKRAGLITFDRRRIVIRDHAGLERYASRL